MIELWHEWNSVHSFKVRVVLTEKGLAWTGHRVELLKFEHLRPEYLRLNPNGVVPTLVHDERVILESSVICQYLDEAFPAPRLLAEEPHARAEARAWLKYFDDAVHLPLRKLSFELMYRAALSRLPAAALEQHLRAHPDPARAEAFRKAAADPRPDLAAVRAAKEDCVRVVARVDRALQRTPWLGGAGFGMADVALAPLVERLDTLEMSALWPTPPSQAWAARIMARPSVAGSRAPREYRLPVAG